MCVCVWEDFWEDWREEEEEKEGADTALKTKTPHVNVGKNQYDAFMGTKMWNTCVYDGLQNSGLFQVLRGALRDHSVLVACQEHRINHYHHCRHHHQIGRAHV